MKPSRRTFLLLGAASACTLLVPPVRRLFHPLILAFKGKQSVDDRLAEFGPARERLRAKFAAANAAYPPARVTLLGLKAERRLEVYAGGRDGPLRRVAEFPIVAASGGPGPKRREGDLQVPEGVYALELLNPNSQFHVSLRVGYPNDLDRALAARESRTNLGSDIMIHGGSASVGCLAMGDPTAEELFVLAAETGIANVTIVLSPVNLRKQALPTESEGVNQPARYDEVRSHLMALQ